MRPNASREREQNGKAPRSRRGPRALAGKETRELSVILDTAPLLATLADLAEFARLAKLQPLAVARERELRAALLKLRGRSVVVRSVPLTTAKGTYVTIRCEPSKRLLQFVARAMASLAAAAADARRADIGKKGPRLVATRRGESEA